MLRHIANCINVLLHLRLKSLELTQFIYTRCHDARAVSAAMQVNYFNFNIYKLCVK